LVKFNIAPGLLAYLHFCKQAFGIGCKKNLVLPVSNGVAVPVFLMGQAFMEAKSIVRMTNAVVKEAKSS